MKQKSIIIGCYALLILVGGIIGYVVAHSLISVVISSLFAFALLICSAWIWKGHATAYFIATTLIFSLLLFFGYRFFLTYKFMPAGMMLLISGALFAYLIVRRKAVKTIVKEVK